MKHISLNTSEEIKKILPKTLEKDLQDNERICPVCHGLGIKLYNDVYGIENDTSEAAKHKMLPYNNQALLFCPNCYNGVITLCEYCGQPLPKWHSKCTCNGQKEKDKEEKLIKLRDRIDRAKEIAWTEAKYYVYDKNSDRFFEDTDGFVGYYLEEYSYKKAKYNSFDEFFEECVPKVLWNCSVEHMSMDADSIIESACEELHEDAEDSISGKDRIELQQILNDWCRKQIGTETYYPNYDEYVKVHKDWFDEERTGKG